MSQVTGRRLAVGDRVAHATGSPHPDGKDRSLGAMQGVVTRVLPHASSGARRAGARPHGKVEVRWDSGSVAVHDSVMIVRLDTTP
jgi:hypothetical protein